LGVGGGVVVLGVGGLGSAPKPKTPNPQSPIPNPQIIYKKCICDYKFKQYLFKK